MVDVRKMFALLCLGLMGVASAHSWGQTAPSGDLQKVIAQLNTAGAKFVSAQADFVWDQYQVVVQDHDKQSGTIYFERKNGSTRTRCLFQAGERERCAQDDGLRQRRSQLLSTRNQTDDDHAGGRQQGPVGELF